MHPQDTIPEEWRPVVGWEDYYSVSSLGRVRRDQRIAGARVGRILRSGPRGGYRMVVLSCDGQRHPYNVHMLVACAFLGPRTLGAEVNHRDGDKANNALDNLEYTTSSGNKLHAASLGLARVGAEHPRTHLSPAQVIEIRTSPLSKTALAKLYGISRGGVGHIRRGRSWKHLP